MEASVPWEQLPDGFFDLIHPPILSIPQSSRLLILRSQGFALRFGGGDRGSAGDAAMHIKGE